MKRLTRIEGQVSQYVPEAVLTHSIPIDARVTRLVKDADIWIEVSLDEQMLYLYQGSEVRFAYRVSTGRPGIPGKLKSMATRKGVYKIYALYVSYPMWGKDWYCPDVPYAMFFHHELAIHAAYWHNDFGKPVSHGCVNMMPDDAKEVYGQVKKRTVVWVH